MKKKTRKMLVEELNSLLSTIDDFVPKIQVFPETDKSNEVIIG